MLDDDAHRQLFVPVGFGHGFAVLSDVADVAYLLSSIYDPATESGIAWDDPDVGVEWPVVDPLLSERDRSRPRACRSGRFTSVLIPNSNGSEKRVFQFGPDRSDCQFHC